MKRKINESGQTDGTMIKKNRGRTPNIEFMGNQIMNPMVGSGNFCNQEFGGVGFMRNMDVGMGGVAIGMRGYHGGMNYRPRNFCPFISVEDRHVMERHQAVYPCQAELDTMLSLVDTIEKALKRVSDKFIAEGEGGERELMGVARVGELAKGRC